MPIVWGAKVRGVRHGIAWDGIETSPDGSQARMINPRVRVDRPAGWTTTNSDLVFASGTALDYKSESCALSGAGERDAMTAVATWVALYYGAPQTRTVSSDIYWSDPNNTVTELDFDIGFPPRAWQVPEAPGWVTVTHNSDTNHLVKWGNGATSSAPWDNVYVERREYTAAGWGPFVVVATLPGYATQWSDTTTVFDRSYQWAVRAGNASGYGPYGYTDNTATSPAAPSHLTVVKSGTTITVGWANEAVFATANHIEHAVNGTWGAAEALTATANSKVYSGVDPAATHQFRIRAYNGLWSTYTLSDVVTVVAPPLAPTVAITPAVLDAALTALAVAWQHNPVDHTAQAGYKLRYRTNGTGAWTELTGTTAASRTLAAGTLTNGTTYEIQVCTKGDAAAYGPWSASQLVTTAPTPSVTLPAPDPAVSRPTLPWAYVGATGQSAWIATLYNSAGEILEQQSGTGATAAVTFTHVLDDAVTYVAGVAAADGLGLWSLEARTTWTTSLARPPAPTITGTWDPDRAETTLTVATPAAGPGQSPAVKVEIWRDGVRIGTLDPDDVLVDKIPPTNTTVTYVALSWADPPTSASSAPLPIATPSPELVLLNAGEDWSFQARLKANPRVVATVRRTKVLHTFAGDTSATEFVGPEVARSWRISGEVDGYGRRPELGGWRAFEQLGEMPAPICYRDLLRRVFGSISEVQIEHDARNTKASVSFTLTEVGHVG